MTAFISPRAFLNKDSFHYVGDFNSGVISFHLSADPNCPDLSTSLYIFHHRQSPVQIFTIVSLTADSLQFRSSPGHLRSEDSHTCVGLARNLNLRLNSISPPHSHMGVYPPSSYQQVTNWRSWSNCMILDFSAQGNPNQRNLIRKSHKQEDEITNNHLSIVNSNGSPSTVLFSFPVVPSLLLSCYFIS